MEPQHRPNQSGHPRTSKRSGIAWIPALAVVLGLLVPAAANASVRPTVFTRSPAPTATVGGKVLWAAGWSRTRPRRVDFLVDGRRVRRDRRAPFRLWWDTRRFSLGVHKLTVRGRWSTRTASRTTRVTVAAIRTTNPLDGALVAGSVTWTALATAPAKRVNFLIDGTRVATDSSAPYEYAWNTAAYAGNNHHLTVRAYWSSGSSADSVDVAVENSAPSSDPATGGSDGSTSPVPTYPDSFLAGPAGANTILAAKQPGALLGVWIGGSGTTREQQWQRFLTREQQLGRPLDVFGTHYGAPAGTCYNVAPFTGGYEQLAWEHGAYALVSWTPSATLDQIVAGQFDACYRDVAARFQAFAHPVFLRTMWEFNGSWYPWSYGGDSAKFVAAWRRIVGIFRAQGATNVNFVWAPAEGWYRGDAPKSYQAYPGDAYVDWVASDGYNWFTSSAWCGAMDHPHAGWCQFEEIFHGSLQATKSVELDFRGRKPYMVAETGSVEDAATPGRKGQWFRNARDAIKARFPGLMALVYFDQDLTTGEGVNWSLETSPSALDGFRDLAQDAYFRTRG